MKLLKKILYNIYLTPKRMKTQSRVKIREIKNPLVICGNCFHAINSGRPSSYTVDFLRRFGLLELFRESHVKALEKITGEFAHYPKREKLLALAEISYILARRQSNESWNYYLSSAFFAYNFVFDTEFDGYETFSPQNRLACELYNHALGELAEAASEKKVDVKFPAELKMTCGIVEFTGIKSELPWKPKYFEQFNSVNRYEVKGFISYSRNAGVGAPLVLTKKAWVDKTVDLSAVDLFLPPQQILPATGIIRFNDLWRSSNFSSDKSVRYRAEIELYDPYYNNTFKIGDRSVAIEADISTPGATLLSKEAILKNVDGLLNPGECLKQISQGLVFFRPYQPQKIPVILVHGLFSTSRTWEQMINILLGNPILRENYQFGFFGYPSGCSLVFSAYLFRKSLHRLQETFEPADINKNFRQTVIVAHSLGGIISKMQTMHNGAEFFSKFCDKPLEELDLDPETFQMAKDILFFEPVPFISRLIMLATPHHGSEMAKQAFSKFFSGMIEHPEEFEKKAQKFFDAVMESGGVKDLSKNFKLKTGIEGVSSDNATLLHYDRPPDKKDVQVHSIIGDNQQADQTGGTDGVVEYKSSHIDYAVSEKVVKSDHQVHKRPAAITEVERILIEHLKMVRKQKTK